MRRPSEELLASPETEVLVPGYGVVASPVRVLESLRTAERADRALRGALPRLVLP